MKPPTAFPAQVKSPEPNDRKKTVISNGELMISWDSMVIEKGDVHWISKGATVKNDANNGDLT